MGQFLFAGRESQPGSLLGFSITDLSHYDLGHLFPWYFGSCWPVDSKQVAGGKTDVSYYSSWVPWKNIFNLGDIVPLKSMFGGKGKRRNIISKN